MGSGSIESKETALELQSSGLIDMPDVRLTAKGRTWLRALETIQEEEVAKSSESPIEDLILSTCGLIR